MTRERARVDLGIAGMTCASCVTRIEKRLARLEGVTATVSLATERASALVPAELDSAELVAEIAKAGYDAQVLQDDRLRPGDRGGVAVQESEAGGDGRRSVLLLLPRALISAVLSLPIVLMAMIEPLRVPGWEWTSLVLATPVVLWGGWPFHRAAAVTLRHGATTMDTLVSLGTVTAYVWSLVVLLLGAGGHVYFEVAAVVTTFLLFGRVAEGQARRRAGEALRELASASAREVSLLEASGAERRIPVALLSAGDHFVVRPGERIAADGVVVEGAAAVDLSAMTGESVPVEIAAGDDVIAGTVAEGGMLVVRADRLGSDTRVARLATLVEQAQLGKTRAQRAVDRVSAVFVPVVIGLAVVTCVAWWLISGDVAMAVAPAVAVLIVVCPCALGLATPTALLVGTGWAAQHGIVISGPEALERAGRIDTVVFDKTGTLTAGRMTLGDATLAAGETLDDVLRLAAAAERGSEHPLGRAIAEAAPSDAVVAGFRALAGAGVSAVVEGREVFVATADAELAEPLASAVVAIRATGATAVVVRVDGAPAAVLALSDALRPGAAAAVAGVRALGAEPIVLSGDHSDTVRAAVAPLGAVRAVGGVSPEGKAEEIARLRAEGRTVAMVGDGVNDAAALATADLGIAFGTGSDITIEAADLTLLRPEPALVVDALRLSRRMLATIRGNLFWAFAYNVAALPIAALGLLDPMIAGAAMAFSSVFVVLNSLRLRRL